MAEKPLAAVPHSPSSVAVFLCDEGAPTSTFAPICFHGDITMRELAEEYCVSSVLECDARGCVQPRAVALDSPLDVLHRGKYYIARRDVPRVGNSPRVTFRGKITVEEFETDHAPEREENMPAPPAQGVEKEGAVKTTAVESTCAVARRRRPRDGEDDDEDEDDTTVYDAIDTTKYTFVPFVGDLYGDGRKELIQLKDAKRVCENVEGDEIEFDARHKRAETILDRAKEILLKVTADSQC